VTGHPVTEQNDDPMHLTTSRRRFIGTGAALAGGLALARYLPDSLLRASEAAAQSQSFDLSQVKHIVLLMQENRSFDHYFGAFPGVRGFSDTSAGTLPDGNSVFKQPDPANPDTWVYPFHLDTINTGAAATPSLSHAWEDQHASWNVGAMDGWVRAHTAVDGITKGTYTMGYYTGADIPFHWALAQSFTLLDNYHCSVLSCTYPNRFMWMTGTVDPGGTLGGGPALDNNYTNYSWPTGAETLLDAGYTFKVYQQADNYSCNMLEYFSQIKNAPTNSALYQGAFSVSTLWGDGTPGGPGDPTQPTAASNAAQAFEEDCTNGTLPDVSWIIPTSTASEHPAYLPAAGAQFIASKLEALAANEELWNSTVFIINYDENDGYFDHVLPPTPDATQYPEEFVHRTSPGGTPGEGYPVGAGFRVPCIIVSPWTTGGQVHHDVSDHTSCLQFIEAVAQAGGLSAASPTGVTFGNISAWRRSTFSDFTDAFTGGPQAAPSNTQFDSATTVANLAAQTTASEQALPHFPGAAQSAPTQES
jgi:phospholipase C